MLYNTHPDVNLGLGLSNYALKLLRENLVWLLMKILDIDLIVSNKKTMQMYRKLYPETVDTLYS